MIARVVRISALAVTLVAACTGAPDNARIGVTTPDRAQFDKVGSYLDHRCGSVDCHGTRQRNLVIYGCEGLRLDPKDKPGCRSMGGKDTTAAELDETYRAVVGLEPAVMSAVVVGKGQNPELLTLIRKARGDEAHKGGALVTAGDAQDTCVISWLGGATNADACAQALMTP